ncbi:hypothetical protein D6D25_03232 [Aureobasidium pullulans]|nr:hypothetical protein D6D25_03232 [Aureobasidium pullulans]
MSVISSVGDTPVAQSNRRTPAYCVSACTHIRMERLYGSWACDTCRHHSPYGWLYYCTSDTPEVGDYSFVKSLKHPITPAGEELRQKGLSESHIKQFEQGGYTNDQLQLIIRQKQHVQHIIEGTTALSRGLDEESLDPLARPSASVPDDVRCEFKVCQRCRPMHKERCWMSFEAVFEDEVRPIDKYELTGGLPVKNANYMMLLGLHPPVTVVSPHRWAESPYESPTHSPSSGYTSDGFSTDEDYDNESCGDAFSTCTQEGEDNYSQRVGNDMAFITLREPRHAQTPRSTIRLVPSASPPRRRPSMIDDESPSHSHTTSSSISLPTIPTTTSYSPLPGCDQHIQGLRAQHSHKAMTDPEFYSGHPLDMASSLSMSSESSFGSEVAVEGGFALTEEAMDTHTPDLFTTRV